MEGKEGLQYARLVGGWKWEGRGGGQRGREQLTDALAKAIDR